MTDDAAQWTFRYRGCVFRIPAFIYDLMCFRRFCPAVPEAAAGYIPVTRERTTPLVVHFCAFVTGILQTPWEGRRKSFFSTKGPHPGVD
jgi:hypothetical protein